MSMIFAIIGALLYTFLGFINAIVVAICIVEDNIRSENPFEYWLALIISFLIWPYFFVRTLIEAIIDKKKNGKH